MSDEHYVRNCYLQAREDQDGPMFDPLPRLDGYAIIPIELYEELSGRKVRDVSGDGAVPVWIGDPLPAPDSAGGR